MYSQYRYYPLDRANCLHIVTRSQNLEKIFHPFFLTSLINVITEWKILSFIFLARIYQLYLIFHGDTLNSGQPQIHCRGTTGAARTPKPGKTPIMAVRRRCRLLFFKIEVRPRSCRSYHIWRPCAC